VLASKCVLVAKWLPGYIGYMFKTKGAAMQVGDNWCLHWGTVNYTCYIHE